jgi:hypothetical protein
MIAKLTLKLRRGSTRDADTSHNNLIASLDYAADTSFRRNRLGRNSEMARKSRGANPTLRGIASPFCKRGQGRFSEWRSYFFERNLVKVDNALVS